MILMGDNRAERALCSISLFDTDFTDVFFGTDCTDHTDFLCSGIRDSVFAYGYAETGPSSSRSKFSPSSISTVRATNFFCKRRERAFCVF